MYPKRDDIVTQIFLARPDIKIVYKLEDVAEWVKDREHWHLLKVPKQPPIQ